jgi:hypothetical protein
MKISHRKYQSGDQRLVKRFLLFPLTLGDETRWLESARIVQTFVVDRTWDNLITAGWKDTVFYNA